MKQSTIADDNPLRVASGDLENRVAFTGLETKGKKKEVPSIRPGQMGLVKSEYKYQTNFSEFQKSDWNWQENGPFFFFFFSRFYTNLVSCFVGIITGLLQSDEKYSVTWFNQFPTKFKLVKKRKN